MVYPSSKQKFVDYLGKAGGHALRGLSRFVRFGYNHYVPHKLMTEDELRLRVTEEYENTSCELLPVIKVTLRDGTVHVGDIHKVPSIHYIILRCLKKKVVRISVYYKDVTKVLFMSDASDYDIVE